MSSSIFTFTVARFLTILGAIASNRFKCFQGKVFDRCCNQSLRYSIGTRRCTVGSAKICCSSVQLTFSLPVAPHALGQTLGEFALREKSTSADEFKVLRQGSIEVPASCHGTAGIRPSPRMRQMNATFRSCRGTFRFEFGFDSPF